MIHDINNLLAPFFCVLLPLVFLQIKSQIVSTIFQESNAAEERIFMYYVFAKYYIFLHNIVKHT